MKAVVCRRFGPPEMLSVEDGPAAAAGPGEVAVSVRAASLNFPDLLIIQDKYQVKPALPFTPGSEFAGVVTSTGPGVDGFKPGERVMAFAPYGAFAEELTIDASRLLRIPPDMDDVTAASFLVAYGTSDHALVDRGHLAAGETLLVLGAAGGVGLAAIQIGKAIGARVIACASSDEKLAVCRRNGADLTIDAARDDLRARLKDLTAGRGPDVVYDAVGGAQTEAAFRSIAWRGRLLVVGFASGEIPKLPSNLALLKGASIAGVYWGEFQRREPQAFADSVARLLGWFRAGKLRPEVSATFPLHRAADALGLLASRKSTGKIVLLMQS
jgi:NADPH2:quinone reductase